MLQVTLSSAEISCDHCIATIRETVDAIDGARFLSGDPTSRQFAIEVAGGAVLDSVSVALTEAGYPLGDASASPSVPALPVVAGLELAGESWTPLYRVTKTDVGADVNYACPCSCEAGFALDRSKSHQPPESCCCGRQIMVGTDAESRLRSALGSPEAYAYDLQTVTMPWGQPLPVALAIPREGAEHGTHAV